MKKLLKVSLVAMLAVGPVAAFATDMTYSNGSSYDLDSKPAQLATGTNTKVASQSYVVGAYNAVADVVNTKADKADVGNKANLSSDFTEGQTTNLVSAVNAAMAAAKSAAAGNGLSESAVNAQINEAAGNGLSTSADGVLAVNLGENKGLEINSDALEVKTGTGLTVDSTGVHLTEAVQSSLGKADTALQSTNIGSGLAWDSTNGVTLSAENQAKINSAITKDVNDLTNYTTTTAMNSLLSGKQDTIDSTHKLDGSLIENSSISATQLDTALNSAINKANSALQSADLEDYATKDYVDERGVVAATTWGVDTSVLVTLSSGVN